MARSIVLTGLLLGSAASLVGCGLMLDYSDYTDGPPATGGGTATGVTSGGGGTGSGATGGSGGSGGPGGENCTNRADDDGDNLVDCEDPDCGAAGYACAPVPNGGWTDEWHGPIVGFPPEASNPTCRDGFPDQSTVPDSMWLFRPPAQCGCQCETPRAVSCAGAELKIELQAFSQDSCNSNMACDPSGATTVSLTPGDCALPPTGILGDCAPTEVESWNIDLVELPTSNASCTSNPGPPPGAAEWRDANARGCEAPVGAGCGNEGSRCIGLVPAGANLCIWRELTADSGPCPAPYANETQLYPPETQFTGTRMCVPTGVAGCQCLPIPNVQCTGTLGLWNGGLCVVAADHSVPVPPPVQQDGCFTQNFFKMKYSPDGVDGWTDPNGATSCQPNGTAHLQDDVTITGSPTVQLCCQPLN